MAMARRCRARGALGVASAIRRIFCARRGERLHARRLLEGRWYRLPGSMERDGELIGVASAASRADSARGDRAPYRGALLAPYVSIASGDLRGGAVRSSVAALREGLGVPMRTLGLRL